MSSLKKNAAIFLAANIAVASVPFLLLPVLTRALGPEGYGVVSLFTTILPLIGAFVGLSVHGAISRRWFDRDEIDIGEYVSSCFVILFASFFIVLALVSILGEVIAEAINLPLKWLYIAVVVSFSTFIIQIRLVLWQVQGSAFKYGGLQFSNALINGLISLLLVVVFLVGYEGRLWGHSISFIFIALISFILLKMEGMIKFSFKTKYMKDALLFGVPLIPHVIGGFLLLLADRLIVNEWLGAKTVGIYMVAVQISLGLQLITEAFSKAFAPWLYEKLKVGDEQEKRQIVKLTYGYFLCLLLTIPITFILAKLVIEILDGAEYLEAAKVLPLLVLAQCFHGMYYFVTCYLFYERKTHITAGVTIISGLLAVTISWFFVGQYGLIGAGIAASLAMFIQLILTWVMAARVHPMPWILLK